MKRSISNFILISVLIKIVLTNVAEQKWYKTGDNKLYYIEENYKFTWFEAFLQCSLKKMSLLTLETEEEHDDVAKILKEETFAFNAPHLWVGAVGVDRQFSWISNSQHVFTSKWIPNNPDNYNNDEYCLHFWENTTKLNDRKCDLKYGFICEENSNLNESQSKYKSIILNIGNNYKK